jgi:LacI family transcriptional regulator
MGYNKGNLVNRLAENSKLMAQITIREVAREAGVSTAVVSYVLRGIERTTYRPETVERVRRAARQLGYEANGAASLLRQRSSRLIGLSVDIGKLYLNPLVQIVYRELTRLGYHPMVLETDSQAPPVFPSAKLLLGLISVDARIGDAVPEYYRRLQKQDVPVVALYPIATKTVDCVATDRTRIAPLAAAHLVELGHRRIAFSAVDNGSLNERLKVEGWEKAKQEYNLASLKPLLFSGSLSERAAAQFLAARIEKMKPRPTALICCSDDIAIATMNELRARGISVPEDISIVGSGLSQQGEYSYPPLTEIRPPAVPMAQAAVRRLLELAQPESDKETAKPRHVFIDPHLVIRDSTAPVRK